MKSSTSVLEQLVIETSSAQPNEARQAWVDLALILEQLFRPSGGSVDDLVALGIAIDDLRPEPGAVKGAVDHVREVILSSDRPPREAVFAVSKLPSDAAVMARMHELLLSLIGEPLDPEYAHQVLITYLDAVDIVDVELLDGVSSVVADNDRELISGVLSRSR